jgi:hypothetical protein
MKKRALSLAAMDGRLMIPANSVRLSPLTQIVNEFPKFQQKAWITLFRPFHLDHFLAVNTISLFTNHENSQNFQPDQPLGRAEVGFFTLSTLQSANQKKSAGARRKKSTKKRARKKRKRRERKKKKREFSFSSLCCITTETRF